MAGPAGTGKSLACLQLLHRYALDWPGMRGLMARKTRESMTQSVMVMFEHDVLDDADGVVFHHQAGEYRYPNGSTLVVRGLENPERIKSTAYEVAFVEEATELTVSEWEIITTRLRGGVMPVHRIIGSCNPDAPTHWLKVRCDEGKTVMLHSVHADNPTVTPEYLARLDALTGVRYLRLRLGQWAAAEGMIYEGWNAAVHVVDVMPSGWESWPRYLAVDFGFINPFVCQWWAVDPDGRLWMYREIYHTQRLVEDHARQIRKLSEDEPRWRAIICDHDAEGRATLERYLGMRTTPATKTVSPGIQAVQSRLRPAGDGKPRLMFLRGALVEEDAGLREAHKPMSTVQEFPSYVWDTTGGRKKGEEPVKQDDHGCDASRYMVAQFDVKSRIRSGVA